MEKKVVSRKKKKSRDVEKPICDFTLPYFYSIPTAGANRTITIAADKALWDSCPCNQGWYVYVPYFWVFMKEIFICESCRKVFDKHGELKKHYEVAWGWNSGKGK